MAVAKKRHIRRSVGFDKKEMEGYFMIANKDAAIAIINKLTGSQLRLWLYLMMVDSFADLTTDGEKVYHSIPSPQEIAIKIGVSPETVEKDMRKLKKLGLYEYRITAWQGHNLSAAKARGESERLKKKKAETKSPQGGGLNKPPERLNKPPERLNKPPERLNKPPERLNKPPENPEPLEKSSSSDSPQTIQTYSDFKRSLSESARENFFSYVKEQTKNLAKPINDLEAWLASKNAANQNRWEAYYNLYQTEELKRKAINESQNTSTRQLTLEEKLRAIANFQNRHNRASQEDTSQPVNTNSEEARRSQAAFDELLSASLGEKTESLADRTRRMRREAEQKRQELARQRREAAEERAKQQNPDQEQRKAEMLRQVEEFNQRQHRQNPENNQ